MQTNGNDEKIVEFKSQFNDHRKSILELISHQTLLLAASHKTDIQDVRATVSRLEKSLQPLCDYFAKLASSDEIQAKQFVNENGGMAALQAVRMDSYPCSRFLLKIFV